MVMRLYVVYDRVAEESGPVFEQKNHALALRSFRRFLGDHPAHDPDDFKLLHLGEIDHETNIVGLEPDSTEVFSGSLDLADLPALESR